MGTAGTITNLDCLFRTSPGKTLVVATCLDGCNKAFSEATGGIECRVLDGSGAEMVKAVDHLDAGLIKALDVAKAVD
ncbi:hypothetical protein D3C84_1034100 [compost metagenome]